LHSKNKCDILFLELNIQNTKKRGDAQLKDKGGNDMTNMMKIEEVAMRLGVSTQTLNRWYKFKKNNPNSELAQNLPDYSLATTPHGNVRLWDADSIWLLTKFKANVKQGRTGRMGKYGGTGTHGEKKIRSRKSDDT
jgi:transcriptional regulator with XRE-family HTH domain